MAQKDPPDTLNALQKLQLFANYISEKIKKNRQKYPKDGYLKKIWARLRAS